MYTPLFILATNKHFLCQIILAKFALYEGYCFTLGNHVEHWRTDNRATEAAKLFSAGAGQ
jgi:hypothetical protein